MPTHDRGLSSSPYLLHREQERAETWTYPFRLEPSADAYLFCWGRACHEAAMRRQSPPIDPHFAKMRRAAGEAQSKRFSISVGLQMAALTVERTEGFREAAGDLASCYGLPLEGFRLPDWDFEPVQQTFDRWKEVALPEAGSLDARSLAFHSRLQSKLDTIPQDERLGDYAIGASWDGLWGNLDRAQFEHLRTFRSAIQLTDFPKARKAWRAYLRIVDYLRAPKKRLVGRSV
jgi:hypothetical protein